jgi:hypothetical protein
VVAAVDSFVRMIAGKPTEFGKMVKLQEAENQIVTDYEVYDRRPNDADSHSMVAGERLTLPNRCSTARRPPLSGPARRRQRCRPSWRRSSWLPDHSSPTRKRPEPSLSQPISSGKWICNLQQAAA